MVTNKVYVNNRGIGREESLKEIDRFSDYLDLSRKSRLHLQLLMEELLGMVSQIGGDFDAEFWAEHDGKTCRLCLEAEIDKMNLEKRETFISVSSAGKNAAVTGVMDKIKNIVELYWLGYMEAAKTVSGIDYIGYNDTALSSMDTTRTVMNWSLSQYRTEVEKHKNSENISEWDELEKSIIANLADDVSVGVRGETVEFVITKDI